MLLMHLDLENAVIIPQITIGQLKLEVQVILIQQYEVVTRNTVNP